MLEKKTNIFKAGAAVVNITPSKAHFLFGYPFVERMSTGVHDALLSTALYLSDGDEQALFISNDIIFIDKKLTARIRKSISEKTGIPQASIMIAATHTHSAPVTAELLISTNDPIVPRVDDEYLAFIEAETLKVACQSFDAAVAAKITFLTADATGIGTNRHDPEGLKDSEVTAMVLRNLQDKFIATMLVCSMHPTVLHEDSTLYSADFPFYVRDILQKQYLGIESPVVYFTGAAGNQSPRHVTKANTFEEAERLGGIVAKAVGEKIFSQKDYTSELKIICKQKFVDLPRRQFPSVEWAKQHCDKSKEHFVNLKKNSKKSQELRTAEVDWFGAEELLYLSSLAESNSLEELYENSLPAEIQIIKVAYWSFVAWPGEFFVEYSLELKKQFNNTSLITYANGELQGYVVTKEAQDKGFYEAANSFFDYRAGDIMLKETIIDLKSM